MITTEHPLRYPLQAIVSLGQLYGDMLYYATAMFDHLISNLNYSRPEQYYFWGYFVLMNAFWIIIPIGEYHDPYWNGHRASGADSCASLDREQHQCFR